MTFNSIISEHKEDIAGITHVYYCTWTSCSTPEEEVATNGNMFVNVLDFVTAHASLKHFFLLTGYFTTLSIPITSSRF
jgi:hypothetical protein